MKSSFICPLTGGKIFEVESKLEDYITIFIPTYKNEHLLLACVKACLEQTYKKINVVVFDNGYRESKGLLKDGLKKLNDDRLFYHKNPTNIDLYGNFYLILSYASETSRFMLITADIILTNYCIEKLNNAYNANNSVNLAFGKTLVRDINKTKLSSKLQPVEKDYVQDGWPYKKSSIYSSNTIIRYFYSFFNLNSELSHFSFINSLIDGALIKSIGLTRSSLLWHGGEEYLTLKILSFSKNVSILNEYIYILYTNNKRLGLAERPKLLNYTRYEPILNEYNYLKEFEPILITRGVSVFKLNIFLIFKIIYSMIRYPGMVFLMLFKLIKLIIKTFFILFPIEIALSINKKIK